MNPVNEMIRRPATCLLLAALGLAAPAAAQTPLTLTEAIARARAQNPTPAAPRPRSARRRSASRRRGPATAQGGCGRVVAAWQSAGVRLQLTAGPAAVYGRRFRARRAQSSRCRRQLSVGRDGRAVTVRRRHKANVAAAGLGHDMATANRVMVDHDLAASVTAAYGRVLVAAAASQSAAAAADTARADRELASNRRDAGLVTDADVLQLDSGSGKSTVARECAGCSETASPSSSRIISSERCSANARRTPAPTRI